VVELSRIEPVDLRDIWPHEAQDFTPWLAEHLDELGAVLGLDLEVRGMETNVGSFSLDILAHDLGSDRPVVIENQLEATNHDHPGKLLTYAAGYDAHVVVWLVREFRDEHRAALDWLNQRTNEETAFFGIGIEAWRIGDSLPAPRFDLVAFPNDWQKQVAQSSKGTGGGELSPKQRKYQKFFQQLIDTMREEHDFTSARKGQPQNWYHFGSGFSGVPYNVAFVQDGKAIAGMYFSTGDRERNKALFNRLHEREEMIEQEIGYPLTWDRRDDISASFVQAERAGSIEDDERLGEIREWMVGRLLDFKRVFQPHLEEIVA
jgi:hypothetical protein